MDNIEILPPNHSLMIFDDPPHGSLPPIAPRGWQSATMPSLYIKAQEALQKCNDIDECAEWDRIGQAAAAYYRQSKDKTLLYLAQRIRLRAIRKCGELFIKFGASYEKGALDNKTVSKDFIYKSKRIAEIPEKQFNDLIDAKKPPSVDEMQWIGREYTPLGKRQRIIDHRSNEQKDTEEFWENVKFIPKFEPHYSKADLTVHEILSRGLYELSKDEMEDKVHYVTVLEDCIKVLIKLKSIIENAEWEAAD